MLVVEVWYHNNFLRGAASASFLFSGLKIFFLIVKSIVDLRPNGKEPAFNAGDVKDAGWISGSGRPPGEGHGNPLRYSHLENAMDRGAWLPTVHMVTKSQTQQKWQHTCTGLDILCYSSVSGSVLPPQGLSPPTTRTQSWSLTHDSGSHKLWGVEKNKLKKSEQ